MSLRVFRYLFWEMLPTLLIGVLVFVGILLSFQALRLTEFVLVHGVPVKTVGAMVGYMSISFLPAILPMSLLFAVLMTYARMSQESEIVAMKSVGLSLWQLLAPALFLGVSVALLSGQTSFYLAPWGNRQFEVLITKLAAQKSAINLREGTFSDGFFDLVVYANRIDSDKGRLENVFIYDERNPSVPVTIIAKGGLFANRNSESELGVSLRLSDGEIHRITEGKHARIDFSTYDINLSSPILSEERKKSPPSLTLDDLRRFMQDPATEPDQLKTVSIEFHKRLAIATACVLFALVGVGLGATVNRRNARSGQLVMCIGLIMAYWILYVVSENLARSGKLPPAVALWLANIVFMVAAGASLRAAR